MSTKKHNIRNSSRRIQYVICLSVLLYILTSLSLVHINWPTHIYTDSINSIYQLVHVDFAGSHTHATVVVDIHHNDCAGMLDAALLVQELTSGRDALDVMVRMIDSTAVDRCISSAVLARSLKNAVDRNQLQNVQADVIHVHHIHSSVHAHDVSGSSSHPYCDTAQSYYSIARIDGYTSTPDMVRKIGDVVDEVWFSSPPRLGVMSATLDSAQRGHVVYATPYIDAAVVDQGDINVAVYVTAQQTDNSVALRSVVNAACELAQNSIKTAITMIGHTISARQSLIDGISAAGCKQHISVDMYDHVAALRDKQHFSHVLISGEHDAWLSQYYTSLQNGLYVIYPAIVPSHSMSVLMPLAGYSSAESDQYKLAADTSVVASMLHKPLTSVFAHDVDEDSLDDTVMTVSARAQRIATQLHNAHANVVTKRTTSTCYYMPNINATDPTNSLPPRGCYDTRVSMSSGDCVCQGIVIHREFATTYLQHSHTQHCAAVCKLFHNGTVQVSPLRTNQHLYEAQRLYAHDLQSYITINHTHISHVITATGDDIWIHEWWDTESLDEMISPVRLKMQSDCSLVVYDAWDNAYVVASHYGFERECEMHVLNSGRAVVSSKSDTVVWATHWMDSIPPHQTLHASSLLIADDQSAYVQLTLHGIEVRLMETDELAWSVKYLHSAHRPRLVMQDDCNCVVYDIDSSVLWYSNSGHADRCELRLRGTQLQIVNLDGDSVLWMSNGGDREMTGRQNDEE